MASSHLNIKKLRRQSKQHDSSDTPTSPTAPAINIPSEEPAVSPVLSEEDEKFLKRLAAIAQEPEGSPPPLPIRPAKVVEDSEREAGKDTQDALIDAADKAPFSSPPEATDQDTDQDKDKDKDKAKDGGLGRKKTIMSYFTLAQAKFKKATEKDKGKEHKEKKKASQDKQKAADQQEVQKEQQDITEILDQLNLSAVNNRVFSFSKESEELFAKFKLVLKDIVNGVPTAYNDLEKLFTDYETQLKKMYDGLPPFLQNMVKSLPAKITATLGPEIMAAQAEKPGVDGKHKSRSKKLRIPSLKSLISVEGAVATMLRSILNFLKLRFPAIMTGTNVVMSLAVCLLLFVFWYCHKRGRETRLEKERLAAEEAESALASSASSFDDDGDSIFGNQPNPKTAGECSKQKEEKSEPPPSISDGKKGEPSETLVSDEHLCRVRL